MTTIGRRKGVRRYGTAHGLRLSETMAYVIREYAKTVGVTLSDALRLLLEQAVGARVNAVEEQAGRLERIEGKLDHALALLGDRDDMATLAEEARAEQEAGYEHLRYYEGSGWE